MKAVLYMRFSDKPAKLTRSGKMVKSAETLETQRERCAAYCVAMGHEIVGEFSDAAKSGMTRKGRVGLEKAIDLAVRHKAVLIAYTLDRVSRRAVDTFAILHELTKGGGKLAVIDEKLDTTGANGRLVFGIKAVVAQYQAEKTSELVSDALLRRQEDGQRVGSVVPFGYEENPDTELVETPVNGNMRTGIRTNGDEQATIGLIVNLHKDGMSLGQIAKSLNQRGVMARGKRFYPQTISRILEASQKKT